LLGLEVVCGPESTLREAGAFQSALS
jgi:hypothetical protein